MLYCYILKSINYQKTYVGSAVNLERRIKEHNSGKSFFTKKYLPWEIIYQEFFDNISEARKREKYFKTATGRRFIKNSIPRWRNGSARDCEISQLSREILR